MAYQIWLGNPYEFHYDWPGLCDEVEKLFNPVIKRFDNKHLPSKHPKFRTVRCNSRFDRPRIGLENLVVYVVPEPGFGFVGVSFCPKAGGREDAGGLTIPVDTPRCKKGKVCQKPCGGKVCSEVYVGDHQIATGPGVNLRVDRLSLNPPIIEINTRRSPLHMAKLIYHEALHNRTGLGDRLHRIRGVSLGRNPVDERSPQSQMDIRLMARNLLRSTRQWTGGWANVNSRYGPKTRKSSPHKK